MHTIAKTYKREKNLFVCKLSFKTEERREFVDKQYIGMSYEEAVKYYANDITRICIIQLKNIEDAKDCFQNVFLKLYLSEKNFNDKEHLKAWLFRVAYNECSDFKRSFWKRKVELGYQEDKQENNQYQKLFSCSEECQDIIELLQKLPKKYRDILYLYYYEEYNTTEIADILKMKVNTVKGRLQRGRKKLTEKITAFNKTT